MLVENAGKDGTFDREASDLAVHQPSVDADGAAGAPAFGNHLGDGALMAEVCGVGGRGGESFYHTRIAWDQPYALLDIAFMPTMSSVDVPAQRDR